MQIITIQQYKNNNDFTQNILYVKGKFKFFIQVNKNYPNPDNHAGQRTVYLIKLILKQKCTDKA